MKPNDNPSYPYLTKTFNHIFHLLTRALILVIGGVGSSVDRVTSRRLVVLAQLELLGVSGRQTRFRVDVPLVPPGLGVLAGSGGSPGRGGLLLGGRDHRALAHGGVQGGGFEEGRAHGLLGAVVDEGRRVVGVEQERLGEEVAGARLLHTQVLALLRQALLELELALQDLVYLLLLDLLAGGGGVGCRRRWLGQDFVRELLEVRVVILLVREDPAARHLDALALVYYV